MKGLSEGTMERWQQLCGLICRNGWRSTDWSVFLQRVTAPKRLAKKENRQPRLDEVEAALKFYDEVGPMTRRFIESGQRPPAGCNTPEVCQRYGELRSTWRMIEECLPENHALRVALDAALQWERGIVDIQAMDRAADEFAKFGRDAYQTMKANWDGDRARREELLSAAQIAPLTDIISFGATRSELCEGFDFDGLRNKTLEEFQGPVEVMVHASASLGDFLAAMKGVMELAEKSWPELIDGKWIEIKAHEKGGASQTPALPQSGNVGSEAEKATAA